MLKERAASALKHGLPVPTPPPSRARVPAGPSARTSSVPPSAERLPPPASRRMPLPVQLLGVGLLLLGVIYGLTLFRDHKSEAGAASAVAETAPSAKHSEPELTVTPSMPQSASAQSVTASGANAAASPGQSPLAADMVGANLHLPAAPPPKAAPPAAKPTEAPAAAQPSRSEPATVAKKALVAPPGPAPGAATNAPVHKVDNPY